MKSNYIYLTENRKSYFFSYIKNANIKNYYKFNPRNELLKKLKKNKFIRIFLWGNWIKDVNKYDLFILRENCFSPNFTKYIKEKNPKARIIMFFWNSIDETHQYMLKDKNIDEFWTFDKNDAKKYKMKYNSQLYSKDITLPKKNIINDVTFLGRPKDREKILNEVKNELEKRNIKTKITIINNEKDTISYKKYLEQVAESKAILDICAGKQVGLSLRCMESIFFEKKLITNNKDIINYEFYDPNNIFIIGNDDFNNLEKFLNSKYKKIDKKIIEYYDYNNWLKRFN